MIPGWTTATRFSRSISMSLSIAVKTTVSPSSMPAAPPDRPVPAPRGTIGTRSSEAIRTSSTTSRGRGREDDGPRQAGVEVRGLVVPVALAVEGVGQKPQAGEARLDRGNDRIGRRGSRRLVGRHPPSLRGRAVPEWTARYDGADVPAHAVDPCGPFDRHHRRLRAGRRAGPRGLSRGRRRSGRAARVCRTRELEPGAAAEIVPGSVNRTSLFVDATYDASLRISWGTRKIAVDSTATIRNTSGAPIDRIELNTIAARLGSIQLHSVTVDGVATGATRSDQTIVVPLGGILPVDATTRIRVRFHATLRNSLSGSNWLFTKANGIVDLYRWLPWVSRRIAFDRPNHGDPFETPSSRSVVVRIATVAAAGAGDERRPDLGQRRRPDPDLRGDERARFHGDRRDRLPDAVAGRPRFGRARLLPAGGARRRDARRRGRRVRHPRAPARGVSTSDVPGRPVGRGVRDGVAGADLDPDRGGRLEPALPGRPRDRPPVVLRDRRQRPGEASRSPTRPRPTSRPATCWA